MQSLQQPRWPRRSHGLTHGCLNAPQRGELPGAVQPAARSALPRVALLEVDVALGFLGLQAPDGVIIGAGRLLLAVEELSVGPLAIHHDLRLPLALLLAHATKPATSHSSVMPLTSQSSHRPAVPSLHQTLVLQLPDITRDHGNRPSKWPLRSPGVLSQHMSSIGLKGYSMCVQPCTGSDLEDLSIGFTPSARCSSSRARPWNSPHSWPS